MKIGGKLRRLLSIIVVVIFVIVFMSYIGWTAINTNNPATTPQPSTTLQTSQAPEVSPTASPSTTPEESPSSSPAPLTQEQIRDAAMDYIKTYHSKTSEFMADLSWTGGRVTPEGLVGAETYTYTSSNWTVTIQYPVVLDPLYTIIANYSATDIWISWEGTCENRTLKETNYTFSDTRGFSTQERVREAVMDYIEMNHAETAPYMQSLMWTGGKIAQGMILGSETYTYESYGWNVTMRYPVYPNPIYTITVSYISLISQITPQKDIIAWQGTWQNGTITETTYTFTP